MKLKLNVAAFFLIFFTPYLYAIDVLVTKIDVGYKEKIKTSNLLLKRVHVLKKGCIPLSLENVQQHEYIATHILRRNKIICQKDVRIYKKNSVVFNFGSIQIEKNGKMLKETDDYITIKKENGKIEKIYKDGKIR